jgi:FkbM family methyltransferase
MSKIYIDCGAHTGRTVEAALQMDYDVIYAFEPNPAALLNTNWDELFEDPRVEAINSAVWVEDGKMMIYREPKVHYETFGDSQGATLMDGKTSGGISYEEGMVEVNTINFASWLDKCIKPGDEVHLKMDIEGSEYVVLPACMAQGALSRISSIFIEFHGHKMDPIADYAEMEEVFRAHCLEHGIKLEEATH